LNPETPGLWARVLVRALVVAAAAVMALGFLGPGASVLVAALTVLTFVLLWLRVRNRRPSPTAPRTPRPPEPRRPRDGD